ncbi:MAG TPA: hypothetical protein VJB95_01230 [Candidatus Paceibacterota bacterium]
MDQNFQTSFIPKKPMIEDRVVASAPTSLLTVISIFIFFTMLLATVGLYFYKSILSKQIVQMNTDLALAKNRFEPTKITELQTLDKRLRGSTEILNKHIAVSPIFEALEKNTLKTIRYTKFDYTLSTDRNVTTVDVAMKGQAVGYRSIALQSDLFAQNKQLIDPVFSNLTLDNKGNVLFDLQFSVDPTFIDYKKMLAENNLN